MKSFPQKMLCSHNSITKVSIFLFYLFLSLFPAFTLHHSLYMQTGFCIPHCAHTKFCYGPRQRRHAWDGLAGGSMRTPENSTIRGKLINIG